MVDSTTQDPRAKMQSAIARLTDLARVEGVIQHAFRSDAPLMSEIPSYLLSLGGKRIRPALTLLCCQSLGSRPSDRTIEVAAGIELIHMATLLHDDIIDNAPLRRRKPSPLARFGLPNTLLSGDFLLVRAFGLCALLGEAVVRATEQACIELVEGETLESSLLIDTHNLESSLDIAKKKTASLFRLGAFCAAHLVGAEETRCRRYAEFGEKLGIAFQILDDVLDIAADEAELGKRPGTDLLERKPSVVNVLWLKSGDPAARQLLTPPGPDEDRFVSESIDRLRKSEVLSEARQLARSFADSAKHELTAALDGWPNVDRSGTADLLTLVDFTLSRME
jgi:geranylgeranyl pyrophosphate synthase